MTDLNCPFRFNVRIAGTSEVATCGLVQRIVEATSGDHCDVDRSACEACLAAPFAAAFRSHPVLPSLIYGACERLQSAGPPSGNGRTEQLLAWAEQCLESAPEALPATVACDVVLLCRGDAAAVVRAAESALEQREAHVVLHLVLGDDSPGGVGQRFAGRPNVVLHQLPRCDTVFAAVHELVPHLSTPFVAIQDAQSISHPHRLAYSLALLQEQGGEILAAAAETPPGVIVSRVPEQEFERVFHPDTLVIRRATLADMGGFSDRPSDADAELVFRAAAEQRVLVAAALPTVTRTSDSPPLPLGPPPAFHFGERSLRECARGYRWNPVEADVVLPFCGRTDEADAALRSVLSQDQAHVIVHLIDDATPADTQPFLSYWSSHPAVRVYRNHTNIGPFASFNNVFPYFETDLAAVQDADDLSLPHRLHVAGNLLRLADADVWGSRSRVVRDAAPLAAENQPAYRSSQYPRAGCQFFLENPTAVIRKAAFEQLGGYADFGERRRNRTGVDTELFARAHHAGCRFAISRDVTVLYREHAESASRHPLTGMSSAAHRESAAERDRRIQAFSPGRFDARSFGALTRWRGITRRLR